MGKGWLKRFLGIAGIEKRSLPDSRNELIAQIAGKRILLEELPRLYALLAERCIYLECRPPCCGDAVQRLSLLSVELNRAIQPHVTSIKTVDDGGASERSVRVKTLQTAHRDQLVALGRALVSAASRENWLGQATTDQDFLALLWAIRHAEQAITTSQLPHAPRPTR